MAQHIYMSTDTFQEGRRIPEDATFKYRGEASGEHDDPQSFKRLMHKRGHKVVILDKFIGKEVTMEAF